MIKEKVRPPTSTSVNTTKTTRPPSNPDWHLHHAAIVSGPPGMFANHQAHLATPSFFVDGGNTSFGQHYTTTTTASRGNLEAFTIFSDGDEQSVNGEDDNEAERKHDSDNYKEKEKAMGAAVSTAQANRTCPGPPPAICTASPLASIHCAAVNKTNRGLPTLQQKPRTKKSYGMLTPQANSPVPRNRVGRLGSGVGGGRGLDRQLDRRHAKRPMLAVESTNSDDEDYTCAGNGNYGFGPGAPASAGFRRASKRLILSTTSDSDSEKGFEENEPKSPGRKCTPRHGLDWGQLKPALKQSTTVTPRPMGPYTSPISNMTRAQNQRHGHGRSVSSGGASLQTIGFYSKQDLVLCSRHFRPPTLANAGAAGGMPRRSTSMPVLPPTTTGAAGGMGIQGKRKRVAWADTLEW